MASDVPSVSNWPAQTRYLVLNHIIRPTDHMITIQNYYTIGALFAKRNY
eukprot:SAG31_NODE_23568_length_501_cov_1.283582_1_plen_48_part_01